MVAVDGEMVVLFQETGSLCCKHKQPVDSQMLLSVSILYKSEFKSLSTEFPELS